MKNIKVAVEGETMTITVDLKQSFSRSGSGKSTIIVITEGNQPVDRHPGMYMRVNNTRSTPPPMI